MSWNFSGSEPKAIAATKQNRSQCAADFTNFIQKQMPNFPAALAVPCFGSDVDEQAVGHLALTNNPKSNKDVEDLGERGAIYYLQHMLANSKTNYDDNALRIFDGAHAFNIVYFDPAPPNATSAIIIEAKGGNSQLGTRMNTAKTAQVIQGTPAYAETIIAAMKNNACSKRRSAGMELDKLMKQSAKRIGYLGVNTKYDQKKQIIYEPVPIFFTEF